MMPSLKKVSYPTKTRAKDLTLNNLKIFNNGKMSTLGPISRKSTWINSKKPIGKHFLKFRKTNVCIVEIIGI
jgi:hypothetical protein